jgi:hypothetical protein
MIAEIRSYIKGQVQGVDSDLKENQSAFYDGDIGEGLIDRSYQITINNIVTNERTEFREESIDVIISIFGFGYTDEIANYDTLLDKALCISNNIIDIANFSGVEQIVNIISNGISAEQLPGDNNGFKIDINLTLFTAYS